MMMDFFRSLTGDVIAKGLDGHYARQKAIISNVANAETPEYKRQDVNFQDDLRQAMQSARRGGGGLGVGAGINNGKPLKMQALRPEHFGVPTFSLSGPGDAEPYAGAGMVAQSSINTVQNEDHRYRNDGNSVDLEREIVAMSKNGSMFKSLITFQSRINQQLKGVISNSG